jgi:hypothetical protein
MRPFWIGPAVTLLVIAACSQPPTDRPPAPSSSPKPSASGTVIHPSNIKRIGHELPPGYEVTSAIPGGVSPRVVWGVDPEPAASPPRCFEFADPGNGRGQSAQGVSGSGSGGIVDAVVVSLPGLPGPVSLDRDAVAACGEWTMTAGRANASVRLTDAPHIDGVDTLGMVADIRTSVESGTEIDSRVYTFTAYLGDYYAFTTLTIDPGSVLPALPPQFASDLLVKTVSTLRG